MRILIVGAGPSGLTAAIELARYGVIPTVIDRKDEPSSLSRAVGILPATMKILSPSGAAQRIEAQAMIIQRAQFFSQSQPIASIPIDVLNEHYQHMYALPQDQTESILADTLTQLGGTVLYGHELNGISQHGDKVTVQVNGDSTEFDLVIAADGVHSKVRTLLGIDFPGYELDDDWSIADIYTETEFTEAIFRIFLLQGAQAVISIPMEPNRLRIISNTSHALDLVPIPLAIREIKRTGTFKISVRQAVHYALGNVFLVGDAAHAHSPVGGRGMNLGIADAADLARRIIHGGLEHYHAERHQKGKEVIQYTEAGRKFILSANPIKRRLLFFLLKLVSKSTSLNKAFVKRLLTL